MPVNTILLGLLCSFLYTEMTGFNPGGIIVPIYFALSIDQPVQLFSMLIVAFLTWGIFSIARRWWILFGRRRFVFLLCVSGFCSLLLLQVFPQLFPLHQPLSIIGWMIPGILANSFEKQGVFVSLSGLFIVTTSTSMLSRLV